MKFLHYERIRRLADSNRNDTKAIICYLNDMKNKNELLERIRILSNPLAPVSINTKPQLRELENIRCVAFDFYGTMFISAVGDIGIDEEQEESNAEYFAEALEHTGFTILQSDGAKRGIQIFDETITTHIETAKNKGIDYPEPVISAVWLDVLNTLLKKELIKGNISKLKALEFGIEFELRVNDVWPVPDLKPVLNRLLDQNLMLGIISNSQYYTPLTFEAILGSHPEEFFDPDLLIWSYETGRKKPSADFYRLFIQAAEKKKIKAEEVLYVGNDIRKDIQPAKEVGMKTALYVGDRRSIRHKDHELDQPQFAADIIIDDLKQLFQCL